MGAHRVSQEALEEIRKTATEFNRIPWWRPKKRRNAAERFREALYVAASEELRA